MDTCQLCLTAKIKKVLIHLLSEAITTATKQTKYEAHRFLRHRTSDKGGKRSARTAMNKVIPKTATAYCLERISRLQCRERDPQAEPSGLPDLKRCKARSLRRPRLSCLTYRTEFYRDCTERCWESMACPP